MRIVSLVRQFSALARLGLIESESYNFHIFNNTQRFVSIVCEKIFTKLSSGQI